VSRLPEIEAKRSLMLAWPCKEKDVTRDGTPTGTELSISARDRDRALADSYTAAPSV